MYNTYEKLNFKLPLELFDNTGKLHSDLMPAYINVFGYDLDRLSYQYFNHGLKHRAKGPAVEEYDFDISSQTRKELRYQAYYKYDLLHRFNAPAVIRHSNSNPKRIFEYREYGYAVNK